MIYVLNLEALLWKLILTSQLKILRKSDTKLQILPEIPQNVYNTKQN